MRAGRYESREGIRSNATMLYGHVENYEHRAEHLIMLREMQDRTGGFTAFIPWPFQPDNTVLAELRAIKKSSGVE